MLSKGILAAVFVATVGVSGGFAQSIADIGGPREQPPSGFKGQQYVDSRGCVFLRAGYGGTVNWVPRVNRERKVLCGYPPTFGAQQVAVVAPEPTPVPVTREAPLETVASTLAPEAPRAVVRQPAVRQPTATEVAQVAQPVIVATQPGGRKIGCFSNSPVPVRVALTNGGTAVICTRGDGTLEGARAPIYPAGSGLQASLDQPGSVVNTVVRQAAPVRQVTVVAEAAPAPAPVVVPKGYKLAWDDDRLNPNRARGTARGQAQQDQVWTRDVPAVLVAEVVTKPAPTGGRVTVSTKSEPAAAVPQAGATLYVQVGTFGVPDNAAGAKARLAALGLPTAKGKINQGGKALQIVYAGPFSSSTDAQSALNAARGAGFGDAFIR
jgi:hypothetical protein